MCSRRSSLWKTMNNLGEGILFISVNIRGVFRRVFVDFSDNFVVTDRDGEEFKESQYRVCDIRRKAPHMHVLFQQEARPRERRRHMPQKLNRCRTQDYRYESIRIRHRLRGASCKYLLGHDGPSQNSADFPLQMILRGKCETLKFAERNDSNVTRFPLFTPHSSSLTSLNPALWNELDRAKFAKMLAGSCGGKALRCSKGCC